MKKILFISVLSSILLSGCGLVQVAVSPYYTAGKAAGSVVAAGVVAATPYQVSTYDYPYQNK